MSDDKPNPVDDLKQGLGLLFRAAKGAVERLPTEKVEDVAKDAAKEVARAFESLGQEVEKVIHPKKPASQPPGGAATNGGTASAGDKAGENVDKKEGEAGAAPEKPFDDAYAPDPPKR